MSIKLIGFLVVLISFFSFVSVDAAQPVVVSGGVVLPAKTAIGQFGLTLWQDPEFTDPTSVIMEFGVSGTSMTLTGVNTNLDEGSNWFLVEDGNVLSPQTVAAGEYETIIDNNEIGGSIELNTVILGSVSDFLNEERAIDFFLGVSSLPLDVTHADVERATFGWIKGRITVIPGVATLQFEFFESVVSYNSPGIIVGTTQTVPEPSSLAMSMLATLLIGIARCQR